MEEEKKLDFDAEDWLAAVLWVVLVAVSEWYADSASRGRLFDHPRDVPVRAAALVLGCSPTFMGGPNGYFDNRMDTAAELWKEGKDCICRIRRQFLP